MKFIISETDEILVSHSGLALAGLRVRRTAIQKRTSRIRLGDRKRPEVSHGDVAAAMIGLLCLGKPDFEAIEAFREDEFFRQALGLAKVASEGTLRQRIEQLGDRCEKILREESAAMIARHAPKLTPCCEDWLEEAQAHGGWEEPREGKEVYTGETWRERDGKEYRVVFEVIRRTIAADGQKLLVPEIEANTFWTSLKLAAKKVIELYHQHGTSGQFHSEIKTDMGMERLPSGKSVANALVLSLGLVAYNVLRLCGQMSLQENGQLPKEKRMPIRKPVARRRLASVIQDLMYLAARLTRHAHRLGLSFWRNNPWHGVWERLYDRFTSPACPGTS